MNTEKRLNEAMMMLDQFAEKFRRVVTLSGRAAEELEEIAQGLDCLNDIYERVMNRWADEDETEEDTKELK